MSATECTFKTVDYFSTWRTDPLHCPSCNWVGAGEKLTSSELDSFGCEYDCPQCARTLLYVAFPTLQEALIHQDQLPPHERAALLATVQHQALREAKQLTLTPDALPDIPETHFVLDWDDGQRATVEIRFGNTIIWSEPNAYENAERFVEIAKILKQKYGKRLRDLRPSVTPRANLGFAYRSG